MSSRDRRGHGRHRIGSLGSGLFRLLAEILPGREDVQVTFEQAIAKQGQWGVSRPEFWAAGFQRFTRINGEDFGTTDDDRPVAVPSDEIRNAEGWFVVTDQHMTEMFAAVESPP
jgi:hypothetical protein